jgi:hypothetical protein
MVHPAGGILDHESHFLHPVQRMQETAKNWVAALDLGWHGHEGLCRRERSRLDHVRVLDVHPDSTGRLGA